MRIDPREDLAGVPMMRVRDLVRRVRGRPFEVAQVKRFLDIDAAQARALLEALEAAGFVERDDRFDGREMWGTTLAGSALAMASAAPPVKRATAQRHLEGFLARVAEANADPDLLHWCTRVWLFGSMLDEDRDRVNDVDLALRLVRREPDDERFRRASRAFADAQHEQGRNFRHEIDYLFAPELEFKRRLKARSRVLSLHDADFDEGFKEAQGRLIYSFDPPG